VPRAERHFGSRSAHWTYLESNHETHETHRKGEKHYLFRVFRVFRGSLFMLRKEGFIMANPQSIVSTPSPASAPLSSPFDSLPPKSFISRWAISTDACSRLLLSSCY